MGELQRFVDYLTHGRITRLEGLADAFIERMQLLEDYVAADTEMLARLNTATSRVAARVQNLIDKVAQLDDSIAADAKADAEALRPVVEQLEAMGASEENPVPDNGDAGVATDPDAPLTGGEDTSSVPVPTGDDATPEPSREWGSTSDDDSV